MRAKKRIFIGSSSESRELAFAVASALEDRFECVLWYEGFFTLGNHFYTDLVQKIITFDYAVMIGGDDDLVTRISTQMQKTSPRDNVYLEYGLFSGLLSPKRVLFLLNEKCLVATDLAGMSIAQYGSESDAVALVENWLSGFESNAMRAIGRQDVELLPTVGVAVGYFYNFIKPFVKKMKEYASENGIGTAKLTVCVPDFICDDIDFYKSDMKERLGLQDVMIKNFRAVTAPEEEGLSVWDMPNTILALFKTVDYVFGVQGGNTEDTLCAKQRALDNFYDNLLSLAASDYEVKKAVVFRRWSEE